MLTGGRGKCGNGSCSETPALKMEEAPRAEECGWPLEAGEGKNRFSSGTSRRNQVSGHLDFSRGRRMSDFGPPEL